MNQNHLAYKPTIVLLTDWLSWQYQVDIWSGVMQAAQAYHQNLLMIVGEY